VLVLVPVLVESVRTPRVVVAAPPSIVVVIGRPLESVVRTGTGVGIANVSVLSQNGTTGWGSRAPPYASGYEQDAMGTKSAAWS
jgi:hypothetical protein